MAGGDDHARAHKAANGGDAGFFRRQGHQGLAALQGSEDGERLLVQGAELRLVVDALADGVQERALDVDAEHAGRAVRDRGVHGGDSGADHAEVVADQGG